MRLVNTLCLPGIFAISTDNDLFQPYSADDGINSNTKFYTFDEIVDQASNYGISGFTSALFNNMFMSLQYHKDEILSSASLLSKVYTEIVNGTQPHIPENLANDFKKLEEGRKQKINAHKKSNIPSKSRRLQSSDYFEMGSSGCPNVKIDPSLNRSRSVSQLLIMCLNSKGDFMSTSLRSFENQIAARGIDDVLATCIIDYFVDDVCFCPADTMGNSCETTVPRLCSIERKSPLPNCSNVGEEMWGFTGIPSCYKAVDPRGSTIELNLEYEVNCRWAFNPQTGVDDIESIDTIPYAAFPDTLGTRLANGENPIVGYLNPFGTSRFPVFTSDQFSVPLPLEETVRGLVYQDGNFRILKTPSFDIGKLLSAYKIAAGINSPDSSFPYNFYSQSVRNRTLSTNAASSIDLYTAMTLAGASIDNPVALPLKRCAFNNGGCVATATCVDSGFPVQIVCTCPASAPFGNGFVFGEGCQTSTADIPDIPAETRVFFESGMLSLGGVAPTSAELKTLWEIDASAVSYVQTSSDSQPLSKRDPAVPSQIMSSDRGQFRIVPVVCPINFNRIYGDLKTCVLSQDVGLATSYSDHAAINITGTKWELSLDQLYGLDSVKLKFKRLRSQLQNGGYMAGGRLHLEVYFLPLNKIQVMDTLFDAGSFGSADALGREDRASVVNILFDSDASYQVVDVITLDFDIVVDDSLWSSAVNYKGIVWQGDGKLRGGALVAVIVVCVVVGVAIVTGLWLWKGKEKRKSDLSWASRGLDNDEMQERRRIADSDEQKRSVMREMELIQDLTNKNDVSTRNYNSTRQAAYFSIDEDDDEKLEEKEKDEMDNHRVNDGTTFTITKIRRRGKDSHLMNSPEENN